MSGDDPTGGAVKSGAGILGVGAAACVACCAGPILGALSAIGVATAVGYAIAGAVALGLGAAAIAWLLYRRRRRQRGCAPERVTFVASPARRSSAEPADGQAERSPGGERPEQPAREPTPG
jgi:hypothetical protein